MGKRSKKQSVDSVIENERLYSNIVMNLPAVLSDIEESTATNTPLDSCMYGIQPLSIRNTRSTEVSLSMKRCIQQIKTRNEFSATKDIFLLSEITACNEFVGYIESSRSDMDDLVQFLHTSIVILKKLLETADEGMSIIKLMNRYWFSLSLVVSTKDSSGIKETLVENLRSIGELMMGSITRVINSTVEPDETLSRMYIGVVEFLVSSFIRFTSDKAIVTLCEESISSVLCLSYSQTDYLRDISTLVIKSMLNSNINIARPISKWIEYVSSVNERDVLPILKSMISISTDEERWDSTYTESTIQLMQTLSTRIPQITATFIPLLLPISNSKKGNVRKLFFDCVGYTASNLKLMDDNIVIQLLIGSQDKDSSVRCTSLKWLGCMEFSNPELFCEAFRSVIRVIQFDNGVKTTTSGVKCLKHMVDRNPITSTLMMHEIESNLEEINLSISDYNEGLEILKNLFDADCEEIVINLAAIVGKGDVFSKLDCVEGAIEVGRCLENNTLIDPIQLCNLVSPRRCIGYFASKTKDQLQAIASKLRNAKDFVREDLPKAMQAVYDIIAGQTSTNPMPKDLFQALLSIFISDKKGGSLGASVGIDWSKLTSFQIANESAKDKHQEYCVVSLVSQIFLENILENADEVQLTSFLSSVTKDFDSSKRKWSVIFSFIQKTYTHQDLSQTTSMLLNRLAVGQIGNCLEIMQSIELLSLYSSSVIRIHGDIINKAAANNSNNKEIIICYLRILLQVYEKDSDLGEKSLKYLVSRTTHFLKLAPGDFLRLLVKVSYPTETIYHSLCFLESEVTNSGNEIDLCRLLYIAGEVVVHQSELWRNKASHEYRISINKPDQHLSNKEDNEEDYMTEALNNRGEKEFVDQFIYEAISKGFLGRYISLVKSILVNGSIPLKRCAIVTCGKYMLANSNHAIELLPFISKVYEEHVSDEILVASVLNITADMQSIIPTQTESHQQVLFDCVRNGSTRICRMSLRLLGNLLISRVIKSENQLHKIISANEQDDTSEYALDMIIQIMKSDLKRASRTLFNIFACLLAEESAKPFLDSTHCPAIDHLIHTIFSDNTFTKSIRRDCISIFVRAFIDQPKLETMHCLSLMIEEPDQDTINSLHQYMVVGASQMFALYSSSKYATDLNDYLNVFLKRMKQKSTNTTVKSTIDATVEIIRIAYESIVSRNSVRVTRRGPTKRSKSEMSIGDETEEDHLSEYVERFKRYRTRTTASTTTF